MKTNSQYSGLYLFALLTGALLAGCLKGEYSNQPDAALTQRAQTLSTSEAADFARTSNDTFSYVFSRNEFSYKPCPNPLVCDPEYLWVGNPVHAYSYDPVTGLPKVKGIPMKNPPANTKAVLASPGGRFMYLLTGDLQLYTYAVGFNYFSEAEFTTLNSLDLLNQMIRDGYLSAASSAAAASPVDQLNTLLEQPDLYLRLRAAHPGLSESTEIRQLAQATASLRFKKWGELNESEQKAIVRLNRLLLELHYSSLTPANIGTQVQHQQGTPITVAPMLPYYPRYNFLPAMASDPRGKFVYVLPARVLPRGDPLRPLAYKQYSLGSLKIYARDVLTGRLTLSATQTLVAPGGTTPYDLTRLIFSASGEFAYGSNNGSVHTYRVAPDTGMLTEIGAPINFQGWITGDPYQNIAMDKQGKFLHILANADVGGDPWYTPGPITDCPDFGSYAQMGSKVYTYAINSQTGALTLSGPPVDTTPHIMTGISVDAQGRFIHLLNTHEYSDNNGNKITSYIANQCSAVLNTSALAQSAIYSYAVDQATGALFSSGSLQAGGAQKPDGFILGGAESVSVHSDRSGNFLYLLNGGDIYTYRVDQANGALTSVGSPLTGNTTEAAPGTYFSANNPSVWPHVCYDYVVGGGCTFVRSIAHSFDWAGY